MPDPTPKTGRGMVIAVVVMSIALVAAIAVFVALVVLPSIRSDDPGGGGSPSVTPGSSEPHSDQARMLEALAGDLGYRCVPVLEQPVIVTCDRPIGDSRAILEWLQGNGGTVAGYHHYMLHVGQDLPDEIAEDATKVFTQVTGSDPAVLADAWGGTSDPKELDTEWGTVVYTNLGDQVGFQIDASSSAGEPTVTPREFVVDAAGAIQQAVALGLDCSESNDVLARCIGDAGELSLSFLDGELTGFSTPNYPPTMMQISDFQSFIASVVEPADAEALAGLVESAYQGEPMTYAGNGFIVARATAIIQVRIVTWW